MRLPFNTQTQFASDAHRICFEAHHTIYPKGDLSVSSSNEFCKFHDFVYGKDMNSYELFRVTSLKIFFWRYKTSYKTLQVRCVFLWTRGIHEFPSVQMLINLLIFGYSCLLNTLCCLGFHFFLQWLFISFSSPSLFFYGLHFSDASTNTVYVVAGFFFGLCYRGWDDIRNAFEKIVRVSNAIWVCMCVRLCVCECLIRVDQNNKKQMRLIKVKWVR